MDLGPWSPLTPDELAGVVAGLDQVWLVGGHAVDVLVGRTTRAHDDIDVLVLRRDAAEVRCHLVDWDVHLAHEGALRPWAIDAPLPAEVNGAWCRRDPSSPWAFEVVFDGTDGDDWVSRRDPSVRRPLVELTAAEVHGLRVLAPEQILLYKSKQARPKDDADLASLLPVMSVAQRRWLADHLDADHPWHAWL